MEFFIKPNTDRESEIWDSGWRCGLLCGILLVIFAFMLGIVIINL